MITKTLILDLIRSSLLQEKNNLKSFDKILKILKEKEGKEVSRRTFSAKYCEANRIKLQYSHGWAELVDLEKYEGDGYNNGARVHCISQNGFVCSELLAAIDAPYKRGAESRTERLEDLRDNKLELLVDTFSKIEENFNGLRVLFGNIERQEIGSFENPLYHALLDSIYKSEDTRDILLSEFYFIRK